MATTLHGVFAIHKPIGVTTYSLIRRLQYLIPNGRKAKIGHGGTLDPLASGVVVIGIGKGCKLLPSFLSCSKEYRVDAMLGYETTTEDAEGPVVQTSDWKGIRKEDVARIIPQFTGTIQQVPPLYSAIKVDGKRLYNYARKGKELPREVKARRVEVKRIELEHFTTQDHGFALPKDWPLEGGDQGLVPPVFRIHISCGGGFYVRSLIRDMGRELGSLASTVKLERTRVGPFTLDQTLSLELLEGHSSASLPILGEAIRLGGERAAVLGVQ